MNIQRTINAFAKAFCLGTLRAKQAQEAMATAAQHEAAIRKHAAGFTSPVSYQAANARTVLIENGAVRVIEPGPLKAQHAPEPIDQIEVGASHAYAGSGSMTGQELVDAQISACQMAIWQTYWNDAQKHAEPIKMFHYKPWKGLPIPVSQRAKALMQKNRNATTEAIRLRRYTQCVSDSRVGIVQYISELETEVNALRAKLYG